MKIKNERKKTRIKNMYTYVISGWSMKGMLKNRMRIRKKVLNTLNKVKRSFVIQMVKILLNVIVSWDLCNDDLDLME